MTKEQLLAEISQKKVELIGVNNSKVWAAWSYNPRSANSNRPDLHTAVVACSHCVSALAPRRITCAAGGLQMGSARALQAPP